MNISEALEELENFVPAVKALFPSLKLTVCPQAIRANKFPDDKARLNPPEKGVYVMYRRESGRLLYVGMSERSISTRIYAHIGNGKTWDRPELGTTCRFPNMTLTSGKSSWLSSDTKAFMATGQFDIIIIGVEPSSYSALIEGFLIARATELGEKPEINVAF